MGEMNMKRGSANRPQVSPYEAALRALRGVLLWVMGFSALINVLMLTGSVYMLQVYDRVLTSGSVPTLVGLFAVVVVLYLFLAFYDALRARLLARSAVRLDGAVAEPAFRAMLSLPEAEAGQPLRDLETVRGFVASPALQGLFDLPFVPLFLAILFVIHPILGFATMGGALIGLGLALTTRALTRNPQARAQEFEARARHFADHGGRNAGLIRAMGMAGHVAQRWLSQHHGGLAVAQMASDPSEILQALSRAFRMLLQSAILTLGAWLVLQGEITAGSIIAGSILSGRALAPIDQAVGQWAALGRMLIAHRRLAAFFDSRPAAPDHIALPRPKGRITVSRLTRLGPLRPGMNPADRPRILTQISFALDPGDGLGVVGNSASGKSTLARLLVGALTPDAGEIRFDGALPSQWEPDALGRAMGYLPQEVEMLPGTIRDNIARFDPKATDAEVIEAAQLAGVHDMIVALPAGYATMVGGGEDPLSGGQRQRVGLARALFRRPAIVVLDEPNANLDPAGEAALNRALTLLREAGSTVIVMAHRPSALAAMNKIMVLHAGTVAQFGDKADLVAMPGKGPASAPTVAAQPRPMPEARPKPTTADEETLTELPQFVSNRVQAKLQDMERRSTASPVEMSRQDGSEQGLSKATLPDQAMAQQEPTVDDATDSDLPPLVLTKAPIRPLFKSVLSRSA